MGKVIPFSKLPRNNFPNDEINREILDAAARANARTTPLQKQNTPQVKQDYRPVRQLPISTDKKGLEISGLTICILSLMMFVTCWYLPDFISFRPAAFKLSSSSAADTNSAYFSLCHIGGGYNCVVDGDTIWYEGNKIRIADIDTPETHPARCGYEQQLGDAATLRLQKLLNGGSFSLENIDRDTDIYGRMLRVVTRNGESVGGILVREGLARWYAGGLRPWC